MTIDVSLRAKGARYLSRIRAVRRDEGTSAAVLLGVRWGASFIKRQMAGVSDWAYDKRTGVDTAADQPGLEFPDGVTFGDAVYYARVPRRAFAKMMSELPVAPADFTFIDLGCGKGAALLLALDHGFRSLVGVELNDRLASIAEQNLERFTAAGNYRAAVEIIRGDVVHFQFPENAPSVVYLYNPFGAATLGAVLDNLENSLRRAPRNLVVAYYSPAHRGQLDERVFLERIPGRTRKWAIYRAI
jgi:predicted RNA methylase